MSRRNAAWVTLGGLLLCGLPTRVRAAGAASTPTCSVLPPEGDPGGARVLPGPCKLPDSVAVLPNAGRAPVLVLNFGLLADVTAPRYECEESFGGQITSSAVTVTSHGLLVGGPKGLWRRPLPAQTAASETTEGCFWTPIPLPGGDGASAVPVADLATSGAATYVLTGGTPGVLLRADDAGLAFTVVHVFPADFTPLRLAPAASQPATLVVSGFTDASPWVLARSLDGGLSWSAPAAPEKLPSDVGFMTLVGVAPWDAELLFATRAGKGGLGDELWASSDGGATAQRLLTLPALESASGFAFGENTGTIYLAGRSLFPEEGKPVANLYISPDAGRTWLPSRASLGAGPRYRCLAAAPGVLYACAGDRPAGDAFLLGASRDEGLTWAPVTTLGSLAPPPAGCAADCAATTNWLCESGYVACGAGDAGARADGREGSDGGPAPGIKASGCSCTIGTPPGAGAGLWAALLAGTAARRRRHSREGTP